ncbi:MAG TPA: ABC transporter permease [Gemmatimonadaceae bacterium]|jgi:putative ABC transport system permease protein|nr:ABC transporter permease [Gemmatimonadaceae bacterium]
MIIAERIQSNVQIALDTLRANKLRSSLTILGVVIGVSTVMAMAAIVQGIQDQIVRTIEIAGPTTFYVVKVFSQTPVNPDRLPKWIRVRPDLVEDEAARIRQLPEISYAAMWAQTNGRLTYGAQHTQMTLIMGADDRYQEIQGGELLDGRWFTQAELTSGANVAVLDENAAHKLFGRESVLDKEIRIGGRPARVIGLYAQPGNIFSPPGQDISAIVPYAMLDHQFTIDKTNALYIPVKPKKGVTTADAQEAVTIALRELRRLRPADKNNFDLITQDQILDTFNKITGVFFLVMIVLSSVGLLVGGIGVMAIMMVSVTSRTREIGIRKALGATKREILFQFLVEAATLTGFGGLIGILIGLAFGRVATMAMKIDAAVPIGLTIVAVMVSVSIGLIFGILPAQRAAKLDPIAALRYE